MKAVAGSLLLAGAILMAVATTAAGQGAPVEVDLELVLAVDVSSSVDPGENVVQRTGYVEAIGHPDIWAAIQTGVLRRIAVTYFEWAGPDMQRTVMPWRLIDSAEAAREFAAALAAPPIFLTRGTGTSITGALAHGDDLIRSNRFDGLRQVIDISGDGPNNRGNPVAAMRDAVVAQGITINGLPLMLRPSPTFVAVDRYYRDCVVGGPGAFVLPVFDPDHSSWRSATNWCGRLPSAMTAQAASSRLPRARYGPIVEPVTNRRPGHRRADPAPVSAPSNVPVDQVFELFLLAGTRFRFIGGHGVLGKLVDVRLSAEDLPTKATVPTSIAGIDRGL